MSMPQREVTQDAPPSPDARVLALDVGAYGHQGAIASLFWYQRGGALHTHLSQLLPTEATLMDQLDILEALAESYPEYWTLAPVVVVGVTVLSGVGKRQVRSHLDQWFNPPNRRRLVSIGDYAGEHTGVRGLVTRKKLRDLIAARLTDHTITLTRSQHDAVALYTGKRVKPGWDSEDEWRADETDAIALPVALACLACTTLLPGALPTKQDQEQRLRRIARAWQHTLGLSDADAYEHARRHGPPASHLVPGLDGDTSMRIPDPTPTVGG